MYRDPEIICGTEQSLSPFKKRSVEADAKILSDTLNQVEATPEEAKRNFEVLRLKGWKRLFPRIFGA